MASCCDDGAPIPHDAIVSNLIFLLAAGVETTERVLTSTLRHLVLNPAEWEWLRANYRDTEKLSAFCAEALRYFPPLTILVREALQDATLGEQAIKGVTRSLPSTSPETLTRPTSRTRRSSTMTDSPVPASGSTRRAATSSLSARGAHHCVGSRLGQLEMMHPFTQLLDRVGRIEAVGELPVGIGFFLHSPPTLPVTLHPVELTS